MNSHSRAYFVLLLGLFLPPSLLADLNDPLVGDGVSETPCDSSKASSNNEFSPQAFRNFEELRRTRPPNEFLYVNETIAGCYHPLSLEEKINQQAGWSHAELLRPELNRYRNSRLNRRLARSRLRNYLEKQRLNHAFEPIKHPSLIPIIKRAYAIRYRAEALEAKYFGAPEQMDNESDSFRHYYGIFRMAKEFGETRARWFADAHERDEVTLSSVMDRFNNEMAFWDARRIEYDGSPEAEQQVIHRALQLIYDRKLCFVKSDLPVDKDFTYLQNELFVQWAHKLLRNVIE